jgi:hypothetical protein
MGSCEQLMDSLKLINFCRIRWFGGVLTLVDAWKWLKGRVALSYGWDITAVIGCVSHNLVG